MDSRHLSKSRPPVKSVSVEVHLIHSMLCMIRNRLQCTSNDARIFVDDNMYYFTRIAEAIQRDYGLRVTVSDFWKAAELFPDKCSSSVPLSK